MHRKISILGLLLFLFSGVVSSAQGEPVRVIADLLELYRPSYGTNALSIEVRQPGSAGDVKMPALFEHPRHPGLLAKVSYEISLPQTESRERIILTSAIAIADGIKPTGLEDGVEFTIRVEGKSLFKGRTRETRWTPITVNLSEFAGKTVHLELLTDALQNTAHDWALWGQPRILHLPGEVKDFTGPMQIGFPVGVIAAETKPGTEVTFEVVQLDGKISKSWKSNGGMVLQEFKQPRGQKWTLLAEPKEAVTAIWANPYEAKLEITQLSTEKAVNFAGEPLIFQAQVLNKGPGEPAPGTFEVELEQNGSKQAYPISNVAPGETLTFKRGDAQAKTGVSNIRAAIKQKAGRSEASARSISVPVFQKDSGKHRTISIGNTRFTFLKTSEGGFAAAQLSARDGEEWFPVASWAPLSRIVYEHKGQLEKFDINLEEIRQSDLEKAVMVGSFKDKGGANWKVEMNLQQNSAGEINIGYAWSCDQDRKVLSVLGPNFYVGDGSSGRSKSEALFPGLEYLHKGEPSSNLRDFAPNLADRRGPHPHKVTIPFMSVTVGPDASVAPDPLPLFYTPDSLKNFDQHPRGSGSLPKNPITFALLWNPQQEWMPGETFPTPRFSAPNNDEGGLNHRLGLYLPSVPKFLKENEEVAEKPIDLKANSALKLEARLRISSKSSLGTLADAIKSSGGFPKPTPAPRTFQEELDLCRIGFLETVWDAKTQRSQHCIGWPGSDSPGFAALMWIDSLIATNTTGKKASRERAELIADKVIKNQSPGSLTSQAGTHIMQWEFPYLIGHLPDAFESLDRSISALIKSQHENGGWLYQPANAEQASLGQAGDSVLGTSANRASTILRYARLTGDQTAWEAGKKALLFMRNFRVPRGGQTWECPMYEPDILAAAYAIRAYHDAYRITGDIAWLKDAIYWAETGVPFQYLWALEDRPMMMGASIPVFGSTFYTHTWLAVPVQWCGLVYSYHLFHLQETLTALGDEGKKLIKQSSMQFHPADWQRMVELITVSGMHQQFPDGDKIGSYPDSIANFETRNPAFLNPEDLLVNVLALEGHDPDIKSVRLSREGKAPVYISAIARLSNPKTTDNGGKIQVQFIPGEKLFLMIAGAAPKEISINGTALPKLNSKPAQEVGWWSDAKGRTFVCIQGKAERSSIKWTE